MIFHFHEEFLFANTRFLITHPYAIVTDRRRLPRNNIPELLITGVPTQAPIIDHLALYNA